MVVVSRVVVVSVFDEPPAPMVLPLPDEPEPMVLEPVEPEAPMELPLPEPVEPVEPDEPEPVVPEAPIDEVDGELVDEPVEAVPLLLGVEPVVEPLVPEAPIVLPEPVVPAALEPAVSAVAGTPAAGAPGAALGDGLAVVPEAPPPDPLPDPPPAAPPALGNGDAADSQCGGGGQRRECLLGCAHVYSLMR